MDSEVWMGLLRHLLTTGAGMAVAAGYVNDSQAMQIVAGVVALVTAGWSWYNKHQHKQALAVASAQAKS